MGLGAILGKRGTRFLGRLKPRYGKFGEVIGISGKKKNREKKLDVFPFGKKPGFTQFIAGQGV